MSPFRRPDSPYWQIRPTVVIPGRGKVRLNAISTGTKDRRRAEAMDAMVRDLPLQGYGDLVELLVAGEVSIDELYAAHLAGQLEDVRRRARDPVLAESIERVLPTVSDDRARSGMGRLLDLVERASDVRGEIRLSYLTDPRNVTKVLRLRESEGVKRNTVRRSLYRAISELLAHELGTGRKTEIMAEVQFPTEDDERQVTLTRDQIQALLAAPTEERFRYAVELALTTGVDRKPLLALEGRHWHEDKGELAIPDRKTRARLRTITLPERARAAVRGAIRVGRVGPTDRLFPWTRHQFRDRWDAAREDAGLPWLRFKDLRAVFATYFLTAGGSPKQLREILGHSDLKTTLRYVKRLPVEQGPEMEATARSLGLGRHLKVEDGGA